MPYIDTARAPATSAESPPEDDFIAPRQRPLDVPVVVAPPQPNRLVIPSLGLDTPVKEVFIVDGAWEVAEYAAGYLHGTGLPGDGNTVLAGHAGLRGAVFRDIGALNPNDDVFLEAAGWRSVVPIAAALGVLLLTGLAWPPGFGEALDRLAAIVSP